MCVTARYVCAEFNGRVTDSSSPPLIQCFVYMDSVKLQLEELQVAVLRSIYGYVAVLKKLFATNRANQKRKPCVLC